MKILLAVTGSISAYKSCSITSVLVDKGHEVQVVMTDNAQRFITPMSLAALSHRPVLTNEDEWNCTDGKIPHIYYTQEWKPDVFVIAPATANTMNKIDLGIADDIVSSMAFASPLSLPKLICPAMNTVMWEKIGRDVDYRMRLSDKGWCVSGVSKKKLACGTIGYGALISTKEVIQHIMTVYDGKSCPNCFGKYENTAPIGNGRCCCACGHIFFAENNNES